MLAHGPIADLGIQSPGGVLACSGELLAPRRLVSLWARLRAYTLDERLARGVDPRSSSLLAARARRLAQPSTRRGIAAGLERIALDHRRSGVRFGIEPQRAAIAANHGRLLALAQTLREPRPAYAGGIAAARLILADGSGPAYADRRGEALTRAIEQATAQLRS